MVDYNFQSYQGRQVSLGDRVIYFLGHDLLPLLWNCFFLLLGLGPFLLLGGYIYAFAHLSEWRTPFLWLIFLSTLFGVPLLGYFFTVPGFMQVKNSLQDRYNQASRRIQQEVQDPKGGK